MKTTAIATEEVADGPARLLRLLAALSAADQVALGRSVDEEAEVLAMSDMKTTQAVVGLLEQITLSFRRAQSIEQLRRKLGEALSRTADRG